MTDDQIAQALEQIARPPADTAGVADSVIERITKASPSTTGPVGHPAWVWIVVFATGLVVAAVLGATLGSRSADEGSLEGSVRAPDGSPDVAAVHFCASGGEVGTLGAGDRVGAVARSTDGDWIAVRYLDGLQRHGWIAASQIALDGPADSLPEGVCDERGSIVFEAPGSEGAVVPVDGEAAPRTPTGDGTDATDPTRSPLSTPVVEQSAPPPPSPTSPPPTSPPADQPPDDQGPTLSVSVSADELWEADGGGISCGPLPRTAKLSAEVSDPSGVADVRATWTAGIHKDDEIMFGSGSRTATIGPHPYHSIPSQAKERVTILVTATDTNGNATTATIDFRLRSADLCFG